MVAYTKKLQKVVESLSEKEKIRVFYELAKYFVANSEPEENEEPLDPEMEQLFDDIANVITDIDNL